MAKIVKYILYIIAAGVVLFLLIQLVPIPHTNPPVVTQVAWDSPQTQALFERSCADCHSNNTTWPWYSKVAPVSWLVYRDVQEGRGEFNISNLSNINPDRFTRLASRVSRTVQDGKMPPGIYFIMHPNAVLTSEERQTLANGLEKTLSNYQPK